ncbi:MAG: phytoene/squalene synthase family protein [Alphaproteobacteria bacterium]
MTTRNTLSFCGDQARLRDPDRYLCALFAPPARREALFALYAFNAEIARARESAREPALGLVRLQWWREAIAGIYAGAPLRHDVVRALAKAVAEHGLARDGFDRLIDARERDFDPEPPATFADLENYAEGSSATFVRLALAALGADDEGAMRAGRHVGIAWALVGLLRAVSFHARTRRIYLPADMLAAEGVDVEDVFAGRGGRGLARVAATLAGVAADHLRAARALRAETSRAALPALLPARFAANDLRRLARVRHDVFDPRLAASGFARRFDLVAGALVRRY